MPELTTLTDWVKILGSSVLIFAVWYYYHKSVTQQFNTILENQAVREQETFQQMNKIIESQDERAKENFKLLQDMVSTNLLQNEKLQRIETKIDDHRWCPYFTQILKGGFNE